MACTIKGCLCSVLHGQTLDVAKLKMNAPDTAAFAFAARALTAEGVLDAAVMDHTALLTHMVPLCQAVILPRASSGGTGVSAGTGVIRDVQRDGKDGENGKGNTARKPIPLDLHLHSHPSAHGILNLHPFVPHVSGSLVTVDMHTQHLACFGGYEEAAGSTGSCIVVTTMEEAGASVRSIGYATPNLDLVRGLNVRVDDSGRLMLVWLYGEDGKGGKGGKGDKGDCRVWVMRLDGDSPARHLPIEPLPSRSRRTARVDEATQVVWTLEPLPAGVTNILANGDGILVRTVGGGLQWYMLRIPQAEVEGAHPMDAAAAHPAPCVVSALSGTSMSVPLGGKKRGRRVMEEGGGQPKHNSLPGSRHRNQRGKAWGDKDAGDETALTVKQIEALPAYVRAVVAVVGRTDTIAEPHADADADARVESPPVEARDEAGAGAGAEAGAEASAVGAPSFIAAHVISVPASETEPDRTAPTPEPMTKLQVRVIRRRRSKQLRVPVVPTFEDGGDASDGTEDSGLSSLLEAAGHVEAVAFYAPHSPPMAYTAYTPPPMPPMPSMPHPIFRARHSGLGHGNYGGREYGSYGNYGNIGIRGCDCDGYCDHAAYQYSSHPSPAYTVYRDGLWRR